MAVTNLNQYYTDKGQKLPTLQDRSLLYEQYGLGTARSYEGTAQQNTALLGALYQADSAPPAPAAQPEPVAPAPVAAALVDTTTLATPTQAPVTAPATPVSNIPENATFFTRYGQGAHLVKFNNDPTVFVQDASGKILARYGTPAEAVADYGSNWQSSIQQGMPITNNVLRQFDPRSGVAAYGFDIGGNPYYFGNPDTAYEAYGTNDWNTINSRVSNTMDQSDPTGMEIGAENLLTQLDTQNDELVNYLTTGYDTEYVSLGLGEIKTNITNLDSQIATVTAQRDAAIATTKANPGMSAAAITGDVGALVDKYNAQLGALVGQRNSMAESYNTGISQLQTKMGLNVQGQQQGITGTQTQYNAVTGRMDAQSEAATTALQMQLDQANNDRGFEIQEFNAETSRYTATKPRSTTTSTPKEEKPTYTRTLSNGETIEISATAYAKEVEKDAKNQAEIDIQADIDYVLPFFESWSDGKAGYSYDYIFQKLKSTYGTWYSDEKLREALYERGIEAE